MCMYVHCTVKSNCLAPPLFIIILVMNDTEDAAPPSPILNRRYMCDVSSLRLTGNKGCTSQKGDECISNTAARLQCTNGIIT